MKRTTLAISLMLFLILVALLAGCSSGDSTSTDGIDGNVTAGKAQALVFSTPT